MPNKPYKRVLIFCTVCWTALVLYGSFAPGDDLPPAGCLAWIPHFDKVVHFIFYAGQTTLLLLLFEPRGWRKLLVVISVIGFSALIEYLQGRYFGRSSDPRDLLANAIGAGSALVLAPLLKHTLLSRIFPALKIRKNEQE